MTYRWRLHLVFDVLIRFQIIFNFSFLYIQWIRVIQVNLLFWKLFIKRLRFNIIIIRWWRTDIVHNLFLSLRFRLFIHLSKNSIFLLLLNSSLILYLLLIFHVLVWLWLYILLRFFLLVLLILKSEELSRWHWFSLILFRWCYFDHLLRRSSHLPSFNRLDLESSIILDHLMPCWLLLNLNRLFFKSLEGSCQCLLFFHNIRAKRINSIINSWLLTLP